MSTSLTSILSTLAAADQNGEKVSQPRTLQDSTSLNALKQELRNAEEQAKELFKQIDNKCREKEVINKTVIDYLDYLLINIITRLRLKMSNVQLVKRRICLKI